MTLADYIRDYFGDKAVLLRLTKPFLEIPKKEFEEILDYIELKELLLQAELETINPLERLGLDLILSTMCVNSKKDIERLRKGE